MEQTNNGLTSLIQDALEHFRELGYGAATIKTHTVVYGKLAQYAQNEQVSEYTLTLGNAFLSKEQNRLHPDTFYTYNLAIQRLNCVNCGVEWHCKEHLPRKKPYYTCFTPYVDVVMKKLEDRGYSADTIGKYDTVYRDLDKYCRENGITRYSVAVGSDYMMALRKQGWSVSKVNLHNNAVHRLNCAVTGTEWTRVLPKKHDISLLFFENDARVGQAAVEKALSERKIPRLTPAEIETNDEQQTLPSFLVRKRKIM